jgi:uncharacterized protein with FMN-binding domain
MSIGKMIPPKWKPRLNSLIGGSVLLLSWFFLDQAERVHLAKLIKLSGPETGGQTAVTNSPSQPSAPAPTPPSYRDRGEREDEYENEREDGEEYAYGDQSGQPTQTSPPPTTPSNPSTTPPPTITTAEAIYRDGVYRATSQAPWGTMTIEVTAAGGKWTAINTPAIPDSPPSQRAAPLLVQQALRAQSATIDGVSGATYTSDAFRDDLRQIVALSKK